MRKTVVTTIALVALLLAAGCNKPSASEKEAAARAEQAAAAVIATNHADTLAMQRSILDAKAAQSEYALMGDSVAVEIFDEEFKKYVAEHNARLAGQMFDNGGK